MGAIAAVVATLGLASTATAGTLWLKTCGSNGLGALKISPPPAGIAVRGSCPGGPIRMLSSGTASAGARETLQATAPPGIAIVHFWIDNYSLGVVGINDGTGYGGGFYWAGGGAQATDGMTGYSSPMFISPYVGVQIVCGWSSCKNTGAELDVYDFNIEAVENSGPGLTATTPLWYTTGWIRSSWPLGFSAQDVSGVCDVIATINGNQTIQGPTSGRDPTQFTQCSSPAFSSTLNTADYADGTYPNGGAQVSIQAENAANVWSGASKNLAIDNQPVTIQMSGPTDAPSTAGVQYISASASAGPSGISGIECSLDNAPGQWYATASVSIPVSSVGIHHLTCYGANNSRNAAGQVATSAPETWTLSIRQPTTSAISFGSRTIDALRCDRVRKRIRVPAHWVTVRRDGKLVKVRHRAHTKTVKVMRCNPRMVRVRVHVLVHGHWRWRWVRKPLLPHTIQRTTWRARYGADTTVDGWLGTTDGTALGGQVVRILTAPDNGQGRFTQVAVVTTAANGGWIARLPAGPSRLVEAVYDGAATMEPAVSTEIRVTVRTRVLISIRPRILPWGTAARGSPIRITGRVLGGYLPPGRNKLLRLLIGAGGKLSTQGVPDIRSNGRFAVTYTFGTGSGAVPYFFAIDTLPEADYPFSPSQSRVRKVIVGEPTPPPAAKHQHRATHRNRTHKHTKREKRR